MFISEDLFVAKEPSPFENQNTATPRRLVGFANMLGKRRRTEEEGVEQPSFQLKDRTPLPTFQWSDPFAMKATLSEPYKAPDLYRFHLDSSVPVRPIVRDEPPTQKRRMAPIRRHTGPHSKYELRAPVIMSGAQLSSISIEPCHRCHRVPRQKKDLQGYRRCGRPECNKNTCSVCTRECGCGNKICSSPGCSVEEGVDGTIVCIECLAKRDRERDLSAEAEMSG